jgi:hypothetical protein
MFHGLLSWRLGGAVMLLALAAGVLLAGVGRATNATAASCGPGVCMRVDAVPGGGVDEAVTAGGGFTVDIVLQGTDGSVQAFDFDLVYDPTVLAGQPPTNAGLPSSAFQCDSPPLQGGFARRRPDRGDVQLFATDGTTSVMGHRPSSSVCVSGSRHWARDGGARTQLSHS